MSRIALVFPGQGSQYVNMSKDFYDTFEDSKKVFDDAGSVIDFDIKSVCFEKNEMINETEYTQASILTASMAIYEVVKKRITYEVCAGLSLGEYNALVATGVLDYKDAVRLVRRRGILMQEAVPGGVGIMMAVLGLDNHVIEEVCENEKGIVGIANYNCPGQSVISGEKEAVLRVADELKQKGAKRVIELNVSGPFHSELLVGAGKELRKYMENIQVNNPCIPYVANVNASYISTNEDIKDLLEKQVSMSVRFEQSVRKMISNGIDTFIEIGPGRTLTGLIKKINRDVVAINIEKIEDLEKLNNL